MSLRQRPVVVANRDGARAQLREPIRGGSILRFVPSERRFIHILFCSPFQRANLGQVLSTGVPVSNTKLMVNGKSYLVDVALRAVLRRIESDSVRLLM